MEMADPRGTTGEFRPRNSVKKKCSDQKRTRVPCGIDDHACTQKGRISPWCNGDLRKKLNYPG